MLQEGIDKCYYRSIKKGKDVPNYKGELISNDKLTFEPERPKSYAFCSDTIYNENIVPIIDNSTVLYHESTFLEEHVQLCDKTKHATAKQAASIARKANVSQLILGHYSTRYGNIECFKTEAQEVFENVTLAEDGKIFEF